MYNQYDIIKTTKSVVAADCTLKRGSIGTIVEIYKTGGKIGYDTEFVDNSGQTIALVVLTESQLELITPKASTEKPPQILELFKTDTVRKAAPPPASKLSAPTKAKATIAQAGKKNKLVK